MAEQWRLTVTEAAGLEPPYVSERERVFQPEVKLAHDAWVKRASQHIMAVYDALLAGLDVPQVVIDSTPDGAHWSRCGQYALAEREAEAAEYERAYAAMRESAPHVPCVAPVTTISVRLADGVTVHANGLAIEAIEAVTPSIADAWSITPVTPSTWWGSGSPE